MKSTFKIIILGFLGVLGFVLITPMASFAQNVNDKTLYKWQDSTGRWYYSKIPPQADDNTQNKVEVAKEARTIIFEERKENTHDEKQQITVAEQKLKQQKLNCQSTQAIMMDTASYLRKINDKNFQEKNITAEEYEQDKSSITRLEEIGSDINFYDTCMEDYSKKPQIKAISNCVVEQNTMEARANCLKELPPI